MTPGIFILLVVFAEAKNQEQFYHIESQVAWLEKTDWLTGRKNWVFMGTQFSVNKGDGFQSRIENMLSKSEYCIQDSSKHL